MNQLMNYLFGRLGKKTCPIIRVEKVFDYSYNTPWQEYYVIQFKDGEIVEFIEKPKMRNEK